MERWIGRPAPAMPLALTESLLPLEDVGGETLWDYERSRAGKNPWNWIEFQVERCIHNYGENPCDAALGTTGSHKCLNGWETCQDRENYDAAPYWIRCCEPVANIPRIFQFNEDGTVFLPLLDGFSHDPQMPDPGESIGTRARFTAKLNDSPHHDMPLDKYARERISGAASATAETFNPVERSTFLRKLKTRFPFYIGRTLRWYQGYITDSPCLSDFRKREYVMESFDGPDANGRAAILCNDLLRLLDDKRAQAPAKSSGTLVIDMSEGDTPTTIDVETTDPTEYDLRDGQTEDYVCVSDEVFTYTGTTPISDGVQLTGVTREAPEPYTTEVSDHEAGDLVQRCRYFAGTVAEVLRELIVDCAGIDSDYVPFDDWSEEANTWAPANIQRLLCEPEGIKSIIEEIVQQTISWGVWFDEIDQEINYRALRPVDVDEDVPTLTDDANIIAGTVGLVDLEDKLINEVQVIFGQIDPTKGRDEFDNYRTGEVASSADSQSTNETGQQRIKRIFARWHPVENRGVVRQFTRRTLNAKSHVLQEVHFQIDRKDENARTAQFFDLSTIYLINALGAPRTVRVQVMQVNAKGENLSIRAREDFFRNMYARWAPSDLSGLLWGDATPEQRQRYLFWAQANGKFTDGSDGKSWV